jgi:hypothetical protein
VEPSASFAAAARERQPGGDVRRSPDEQLPFPDGAFDVALAQLVVHVMADPVWLACSPRQSRRQLPAAAIEVTAVAWAVSGRS